MSGLIEGLPDAVVLRCLARVPFHLHPMLELVSRSWRAAIRSTELFKVRQEVGSMEDFLCVCTYDPENLWQLYDPLQDLWITLPILPSRIRYLAHFGVVSTAGKLFVLGGGSDAVDPLTSDQDGSFATNEVWSYDPVAWQWSPHASMRVPRATFACCVLNGKVIVAGSFTSCRKSISQAELYDPDKDVWIPLPDLQRTHNSPCSGILLDGKVHVVHKGLPRVQVWDHADHKWMVKDYSWDQGPMTMLRGSIYVICHGNIFKQERYSRRFIGSASEFRKRIGFCMFRMGDEIYIVGRVIGPDRWNWDRKPLSNVDCRFKQSTYMETGRPNDTVPWYNSRLRSIESIIRNGAPMDNVKSCLSTSNSLFVAWSILLSKISYLGLVNIAIAFVFNSFKEDCGLVRFWV